MGLPEALGVIALVLVHKLGGLLIVPKFSPYSGILV